MQSIRALLFRRAMNVLLQEPRTPRWHTTQGEQILNGDAVPRRPPAGEAGAHRRKSPVSGREMPVTERRSSEASSSMCSREKEDVRAAPRHPGWSHISTDLPLNKTPLTRLWTVFPLAIQVQILLFDIISSEAPA